MGKPPLTPTKLKKVLRITFTSDSYTTRVRLEKPKTMSVNECIFMLEQYLLALKKETNVK